jgi:hypothetical protein
VVEAAQEWNVGRVGVASTIGVYAGTATAGPLREDMPLPLSAPHPIPRGKKIDELLAEQLSETTGIEIVNYRISGTWGPLGHADPFFAAPALIHAAARGTEPDLSVLAGPAYAEDALDLCYVKDTGRAIALLQLADHLTHRTYNVGSGRSTSNAQIIDAIKTVVPDARVDLPTGRPASATHLDISRLEQDTGFRLSTGPSGPPRTTSAGCAQATPDEHRTRASPTCPLRRRCTGRGCARECCGRNPHRLARPPGDMQERLNRGRNTSVAPRRPHATSVTGVPARWHG